MSVSQPVLRFAPTPNGYLHLGHAYSALFTHDLARQWDGRFLLRMEDIDPGRCRPEYDAAIREDLAWLGLTWEKPVLRQSEHLAHYEAALARLDHMGLLYDCFASRQEVAKAVRESKERPVPRDPDGAPLYPGIYKHASEATCRALKARGVPYARRLHMDRAAALAKEMAGGPLSFQEMSPDGRCVRVPARPEVWGDVILARKDVPTSYHIAVVVDDARQGITHVSRGADLYAATAIHRLLQVLLGLPEPIYIHHRLIVDEEGRKLAKRRGSQSLRALREQGLSPADIRRLLSLPPSK